MAATAKAIRPARAGEAEEDPRQNLLFDPRPRTEINNMVMEAMQTAGWKFWAVTTVVALFVLIGLLGVWIYLILNGMGVTGTDRPIYWGVFLSNTVFWIGISHTGAFVSALLRVFKTGFHHAITRVAEFMAVFGIIQTGLSVFMHLGRVWRSYWLIPFPNERGIWPDFHSPLMWDFMAITTYMIVSALYLILPLIPDLAMIRDRSTGWRKKLYRIIALGFRGTEEEWKHLRAAIKIFSFAMIPVMVSVTTVVSWDFAMATRPGWSSTVFGPFFVVGAFHSGVAALVALLAIIRIRMKNMKYFIRPETFDSLGKLMLIISMGWAYLYFNDYMVPWYGGTSLDRMLLKFHETGPFAPMFFMMIAFNAVIPWALLWNKKVRRTPWAMFIVGLLVVVGMWFERFLIVPGSLTISANPFTWRVYQISWVEISLTLGTVAFFALLYLLASRFLPFISPWEVQEGQESRSLRKVGKAALPSTSEID